MNINGAFRFHSVGQGLFYSGIISKKSSHQFQTFNFVYDCGTLSSRVFLKKEIDTFINDYYDRYSGLYLKSKEFLKNLEKI